MADFPVGVVGDIFAGIGGIADLWTSPEEIANQQNWANQTGYWTSGVMNPVYQPYTDAMAAMLLNPGYDDNLKNLAMSQGGLNLANQFAGAAGGGKAFNTAGIESALRGAAQDVGGVMGISDQLTGGNQYADLRSAASNILSQNMGALDAAMGARGLLGSSMSANAARGVYGDVFSNLANEIAQNELARLQTAGQLGTGWNQLFNTEQTARLGQLAQLANINNQFTLGQGQINANLAGTMGGLGNQLMGMQADIFQNLNAQRLGQLSNYLGSYQWLNDDTLKRYNLGSDMYRSVSPYRDPQQRS